MKHSVGTQYMVLGAIMIGRRTDLVLIDGSLTPHTCHDNILQPVVHPIAGELHPDFVR